jgi:hypothetical protein
MMSRWINSGKQEKSSFNKNIFRVRKFTAGEK